MSTKKSNLDSKMFQSLLTVTKDELSTLLNNGLPPCVKISDGKYLVGQHAIELINSKWAVMSDASTTVKEFRTFKSAMYYCVFLYINSTLATKIVQLNDKIDLLLVDKEIYEKKLKKLKSTDLWKFDLITARYTTLLVNLEYIQTELKKFLTLGKYNILGKIAK